MEEYTNPYTENGGENEQLQEEQNQEFPEIINKKSIIYGALIALVLGYGIHLYNKGNKTIPPELKLKTEMADSINVTGGKRIFVDGKTLKIKDLSGKEEIIGKCDKKGFGIVIRYADEENYPNNLIDKNPDIGGNPNNLIDKKLNKGGTIIVERTPCVDPEILKNYKDSINLDDYTVRDTAILYTTQESIISGLNNLKNITFQVGGTPTNLLSFIELHDATIEEDEVTIRYENGEEENIDPRNFNPKYDGKATIEITVNKEGKIQPCFAEINILPNKREPIESTLEHITLEEIFPDLNSKISYNDTYNIEHTLAPVGYELIQFLLSHGSTNLSPKEYKEYLERIVIVFAGGNLKLHHETIGGQNTNTQNNENLIKGDILGTLLPNTKYKNVIDDDNDTRPQKMLRYAKSHPNEIIIISRPPNKDEDENTKSEYEKDINELNKLENVILLTESAYYNELYIALTGIIAKLNPKIKNAKELEDIVNLSTSHSKITTRGYNGEKLVLPNIRQCIEKLTPDNQILYINFSDDNPQYELQKGDYPQIYDVPGIIMEHNGERIPVNGENGYMIDKTNIIKYNQVIDKDELKRLGYDTNEPLKLTGNKLILNKEGKILMVIPIIIEINIRQ